jgi:hypothetical protein
VIIFLEWFLVFEDGEDKVSEFSHDGPHDEFGWFSLHFESLDQGFDA